MCRKQTANGTNSNVQITVVLQEVISKTARNLFKGIVLQKLQNLLIKLRQQESEIVIWNEFKTIQLSLIRRSFHKIVSL